MNKKFTYKAVLYSYNEDDRVYSSFSEKKDYANLLKIEKTFMDEVGLKKNCFELASDLFKKRGHEYDWDSDNGLCVGIVPNRGNVRAESFRDWVLCGCRN